MTSKLWHVKVKTVQDKLPLSVVIITLNEERNILRCLSSVSFASECLIIDSGSTDQTLQIAEKMGAKTMQQAWMGFGPQKQYATDQAQFDWVLNIDADEAVSLELAQEIHARFKTLDPKTGYLLPRKSFHFGKWIRYGGWYPDLQLRLYHKKNSKWSTAQIHEKVLSAKTERLKSPLLHWVFKDLYHQVQTNNRYSTLQAEALFLDGKRASLFRMVIKPVSKFIECYFWKRGFCDGRAGFVIAIGAAYSVFLKWSKLWELQKVTNRT